MVYEKHDKNREEDHSTCNECKFFQEKVGKYQKHKHTFTCEKKKKTITIKENEGHGINIKSSTSAELQNIPICRFHYPRFPMEETKLILGVSSELDETIAKKRNKDLNKVMKFLLRQTVDQEAENWINLKNMNFLNFIYETGMFTTFKPVNEYTDEEIKEAKERYINAISMSVKGTGKIFLRRNVKDIFTNGYNKKIMRLH